MDIKTLEIELGNTQQADPIEIISKKRGGRLYYFFKLCANTPEGVAPYIMVFNDKFSRNENPIDKWYSYDIIKLEEISSIRKLI